MRSLLTVAGVVILLPPGLAQISHDELVLIELQGTLEVECTDPAERDGRLIGTLCLDTPGKPTLRIGHHLLEGKVASLPKPLAVLVRAGMDAEGESMSMEWEADTQAQAQEQAQTQVQVGWDVVAIVKKKIVFSTRPMPIVGRRA
ncbi:chromosome transmission fidelity protein 8 [Infundibulicybe gibba]|nr:chromosome transmission fidelity protein 8 [Infundibulicybe gibba]